MGIRLFWDLTRDFWAENAKNNCKVNKAGDLWVEMCGGLLRISFLGILHCVQDDSKGQNKEKCNDKDRGKDKNNSRSSACGEG